MLCMDQKTDCEITFMEKMSCAEILANLEREWDTLRIERRAYLMSRLVDAGCREVIPYLLRHLKSNEGFYRWRALFGLADLKCREYRQLFIDFHLNDPDDDVRRNALICLCDVFRGERDVAILQLALAAFDNPASSVAMRLTAGAVMMYQLDISDETGGPGWWNQEEEDLQHPALMRAVAETRQLLAEGTSGCSDEAST